MQDIVDVIEIETTSRLLAYLRPSKRHWRNGHWLFRGQRSASDDWQLLPSAWRQQAIENGLLSKIYNYSENPGATIPTDSLDRLCKGRVNQSEYEKRIQHIQTLVLSEYAAVATFIGLLNRIGVQVPNGGDIGRPNFERFDEIATSDAFALAQHHLVPTRLLDWTTNPLVAAFFASQKKPKGSHIAIWAIDEFAFAANHGYPMLKVKRAPRASIGFLHAQSGLFTIIEGAEIHYLRNGEWPALELTPRFYKEGSKPLRKIILPAKARKKLQYLLWCEGISLAHLMPTHDNVTKTAHHHWNHLTARSKRRRLDQDG